MTVLITLTIAGSDTGPFDLFSNSDGFTVPFATNVPKASLESGYLSAVVPDTTAIIRCSSLGVCTNYTEMFLITTTTSTTTTTTTTAIPCGATASSGGVGITDSNISLSPSGGIVIVEMNAQSVPDKLEIVHNGVKKATTSMLGGSSNSGPFDNVYGTPPGNVIPPDSPSVSAINQFIGSSKGIIPTRDAEFLSDTGIPGIVVEGGYQQLVWWEYTPSDYAVSNTVVIRVTGTTGTSWNLKRLCPA